MLPIVCTLISLVLCGGTAFFFFCLVLGIVLLRRRGKKITARKAVTTGVQTVSSVFRRNEAGDLVEVGADEDDA